MAKLNYNPKNTTKKITSHLNKRSANVIKSRFGVSDDLEKETLESIGEKYGITRERVRQIQEAALASIKKSEAYKNENAAFEEIRNLINSLGTVATDDHLSNIIQNKEHKNHIDFHLTISDLFKKHKRDGHFVDHWSTDKELLGKIHSALKKLYDGLGDDELVPETEIIKKFLSHLKDVAENYKNDEIAKRWLSLSHKIAKNPIGEWGKSDSCNVKMRGVKDYAFLVLKDNGKPMHFREVAEEIEKRFNKKVNSATCHNELIKDKRFVLVGRGLYALTDWGYKTGTASEVIRDLIKTHGPLSKEDIIEKMSQGKCLRKNTILVNLCNTKYFKRRKDGLYVLA